METTLVYDRVVLTKELNEKFKKVGEVFEIASILNDNSFLLRDSKTRVALGVVSFEDFEKHFVHEENFKGWTDWTPIVGFDNQSDAVYRTNRRKTQVRFLTDRVMGESFLNKDNEFNLYFGIRMAYLRCLNKANFKKAEKYEKELKNIYIEMTDNERAIEDMIKSLPN